MSASPPVPRPPIPPRPPRTGSRVVAIVLLVLGMIVLVCGLAVWTGLKYLSRHVQVEVAGRHDGRNDVSVNTPIGSLEVRSNVRDGDLDLPLYPGATRVTDKDATSVNLDFGDEANVRVRAAKYETADPLEKVKAFYKRNLGTSVTKFVDKDEEGTASFEIKTDRQEKIVELKREGDKTTIELVHVSHGKKESN